jgi:hypothetical protein
MAVSRAKMTQVFFDFFAEAEPQLKLAPTAGRPQGIRKPETASLEQPNLNRQI